jgi:quinoprotein dehydrogenase-associated probable ABC transporter substrate-binding protein
MVAAGVDHQRLYDHHPGPALKHGRRLALLASIALLAAALESSASAAARHLVICADPNNLPFSNRQKQGFENKIMERIARDLDARLSYLWWAQRRGYVRSTLNEARCDIWPGVATGTDHVASTHPYYRSTYVFVTRERAPLGGLNLDDPRLRSLTVGVQMIGNDSMNSPPAHAIASRGMTDNVRGFMIYGDYELPNPPAAIVEAVANRQIDVAMVWGPLAGYFAHRSPVPLRLEPVTPANDPRWPMAFDISMGVRRGNETLLAEVDAALERERAPIRRILGEYHVPLEP